MFREVLVGRGVTYDAPAMRLAHDLAALGANPSYVGAAVAKQNVTEAAILYPTQVRFVRVLTDPASLALITDPAQDASELCRQVVAIGFGRPRNSQLQGQEHRSATLLSYAVERLRTVVRDGQSSGTYRDDPWNLLRPAGITPPAPW